MPGAPVRPMKTNAPENSTVMRFAHFKFDPKADRLGEGNQCEVFRAVDSRLNRTVALKILRPHVEFDPAAVERFEREARHTSSLAHPNIATVFEYATAFLLSTKPCVTWRIWKASTPTRAPTIFTRSLLVRLRQG